MKPEFVGQAKIRRYVIMSAIGCSVWTAGNLLSCLKLKLNQSQV